MMQRLRAWADSLPAAARALLATGHDMLMAAAAFVLALYLRLGDGQFDEALPYLLPGTLIFTAICAAVFTAMRLYRGLWRYTSLADMAAMVRAATLAVALFSVAMFAANRLEGVPRSLPFIAWLLLIALLAGPRVAYRALKEGRLHGLLDARGQPRQIPLLLVGATGAADLFIRDTLRDSTALYRIVGLVDDDPGNLGRSLHGIRIYGGTNELPAVLRRLDRLGRRPQRLILADDTLPPKQVRALLAQAEKFGLSLGRLPRLEDFRDGEPGKAEPRPIAIEDLLGRAQVVHDRTPLEALVSGKRVAVTGAGGSIGAELVRQLAALKPESLLLVDASEHFLYLIDRELEERWPELSRRPVIADVRDVRAVSALFMEYKPALVFHAAAIKHVPLSESNPLAAISVNVLGSRNVARAAREAGAAAMVLISTDKAVHPTNVMGAAKRLAETWCQALGQAGQGQTRFLTVRFGNVLGSHGSVVPLFERQIREGGPLTVTHPDMVRYFMTIREAVELVLHAAALGARRDGPREATYVLDMGSPVRIAELAAQMIRLAGRRPGEEIEIVYTGLRPGEKLFEELFYDEERVAKTALSGVLIAAARERALAPLENSLATLEKHCRDGETAAALSLLASLVPEFRREPSTSEPAYAPEPRAALRLG